MTTGQLTTAGLTAAVAGGLTATKFPYVALGTGSATFALNLNAMGSELAGSRVAITSLTGIGAQVNVLDYLSNNQGIGTLTEIGLWDAASNGNLLAYKMFDTALAKTAARPMLANFVMELRNLHARGKASLTAAGLVALRTGGFTVAKFPYIAVGNGTKPQAFKPSLTTMANEIARVGTAITLSTVTATVKGTFGAGVGTGTWTEIGLWDASSGGNLLAYMKLPTAYVKAAGVSRKAVLTFTVANNA